MVHARGMRHRVDVQRRVEGFNAFGDEEIGWETVAVAVPCSIKPLAGREAIEAGKVEAQLSHRIRCRFHRSIDPTVRLLFGTREFHPRSVKNIDERSREMEILAEEVVA